MPVLAVRAAEVAYPTGNPKFSVMQCFPAAFTPEESDPFLMCDMFGPTTSEGVVTDEDSFPVDWHPHRGMDILTYMVQGKGRHADSLGNRETFDSPGMQWISVGSGIEHAEGGGTERGEVMAGFQIWVNVPSARKMDDPRYGTEPPENIPVVSCGNGDVKAHCRIIAGEMQGQKGPFKTVQDVQMVDYTLPANTAVTHHVPDNMDNCLVYVYAGIGKIAGIEITKPHTCIRMDASCDIREFHVSSGNDDLMSVIIFAGKRLDQPVAWRGPIVMTTDEEIATAMRELRSDTFLKKKVSWDFKRISAKPI